MLTIHFLWLQRGIAQRAKFPQTREEMLLTGVLLVIGLCLAVVLLRRIAWEWRRLDQQTRQARFVRRGKEQAADLGPMPQWMAHFGARVELAHRVGLRGRNLRGADLAGAFLQDVDLSDADLRNADLRGADLRGAHLRGADLTGARYDENTCWPEGFEPRQHGAVLVHQAT
jgi:hypothetical protein